MNNNNLDLIIKGLVKEFTIEGTKTFLTKFNIAERRVIGSSIFIGKIDNITYMCNGKVLMGYINRPGDTAIQFTFGDLNKLPWTSVYNHEGKVWLKNFTHKNFVQNNKLMERYRIIMEASRNYEALLLRAVKGRFVKPFELNAQAKALLKKQGEVAMAVEDIPQPQATEETTITVVNQPELTVMQLAHKIRREEKLEGHYHAQMKYALAKAHAIKKGVIKQEVIKIYEEQEEQLSEVAATIDSIAIEAKEHKSPQEIMAACGDKYDAYVFFKDNEVHMHILGKEQILKTKYSGLKLEKEFRAKIPAFGNKFGATLVMHNYDVFDQVSGVHYVKMPN